MSSSLEDASLSERFEHLVALFSSERFLACEGLGNEVPFFVCPYPPNESVEMDEARSQLVRRLQQEGIQILEVNLYDLSIDLLKRDDDLDWILESEAAEGKDKIMEHLQGVLDTEHHLVPAIADMMDKSNGFQILFLTGVGEVFPYIRSHNVLNNLQKAAKERPTVMFFPGEYSHSLEKGASLDLFGRLRDDKYYRAYNVFEREV
jgi:hypothetical protein